MLKHLVVYLLFCLSFSLIARDAERFEPFKIIDGSKPSHGKISDAADGNWRSNYWTNEKKEGQRAEHFITLDLGESKSVHGFVYIPDAYNDNGRVKKYCLYVSDSDSDFGAAVHTGELPFYKSSFWPDRNEHYATVKLKQPATGRYVKFVSLSDHRNSGQTAIAEFVPITDPDSHAFKGLPMVMLKGLRMAPSIHLGYRGPEAKLYYLEMTPKTNPEGTYYMAIGFANGYFGIQEQRNGNRVALFSVWDSAETNNPNAVPEERRVKVLYADPEMRVQRFGGEGVGVQSFLKLNWKVDETYKFVVKVDYLPDSNLTVYTSWLFDPAAKDWRRLTSLGRPGTGKHLTGFHSFVEDFRRNFDSYWEPRTAEFTNVWLMDAKTGEWQHMTKGLFTVDGNPRRNIDAKPIPNGGSLTTGGDIENATVKVHSSFDFTPVNDAKPPELPAKILNAIK